MRNFRNGFFAVGLFAMLSACWHEAEPTPFRLGQTIPLGTLDLEIISFEPVPPVHAPLSTLRTAPEDRAWALHVRWSGLSSLQGSERQILVEKILEKRLWVKDMDGDLYRPIGAMAMWLYRSSPLPPASVDRDWIVVFHTPEVSRDFTLFIENQKPEAGQPALASVVLAESA